MPEEALEQWLARLERKMDEHGIIDSEHASRAGHSGHQPLADRVERLDLRLAEHMAHAGHAGYADMLARVNRLEYGIGGTLVGVIFLIVKSLLPGHAG